MTYSISSMTMGDQSDEERFKFLRYITPIIIDYAENNQIDPAVCYEVCHQLELMMIENVKKKGSMIITLNTIRK
jgi:hypothetical protein